MARTDLKRVILIMNKEDHKILQEMATDEDWSVSGICRKAIKEHLAKEGAGTYNVNRKRKG